MNNNETKQVTMTAEELERFEAFKAEEDRKAKEARKKQQLIAYRELVDKEVCAAGAKLIELFENMHKVKKEVFEGFTAAISMKREVLNLKKKEGQFTHTFTSSDSKTRISLGNRTTDKWADTVADGVDIVREFLESLATSEETAMLVRTVMRLLSKDKEGNMQASRVIQLMQIAQESGNERFIEGVRLIWESYRPEPSKSFIKLEVKDEETGKWKTIPLSMTEIDA